MAESVAPAGSALAREDMSKPGQNGPVEGPADEWRGPRIRPATLADVPAGAAVLSRAFKDKEPFVWLVPDAARRAQWLPAFFTTTLTHVHPPQQGGEVAVVGDVGTGWAIWSPPGAGKRPLRSRLGAAVGTVRAVGLRELSDFGRRGTAVERALEAARPKAPHWYLAGLGVDPDWSGRGIGRALLSSGLVRSDHQGMPTYLECLEGLVPYYEQFGFELSGWIDMPEGTARQAAMWRAP